MAARIVDERIDANALAARAVRKQRGDDGGGGRASDGADRRARPPSTIFLKKGKVGVRGEVQEMSDLHLH